VRRETCSSAEEFEALVQRNMAANCGLDFRAAAAFVGCIAARELSLIRQPAISRQEHLMHLFNLKQALPVLDGLLAGLDSCACSHQKSQTLGSFIEDGLAQRSSNMAGDRCCPQDCAKDDDGLAAAESCNDERLHVSVADVLGCDSKDDFVQLLRNIVNNMKACVASEHVKFS
jgi:hypothetical protein